MDDRQKNLFPFPSRTEISKAATLAITALRADHPEVDDEVLANLIGSKCAKTVARIVKGETDKVPATLFAVIGRKFGRQYISYYLDLIEIPQACNEAVNALPALTSLTAKVAAAMTEGRKNINHQALAGMLSELRDVDAVVSQLRARASDLGMAA